MAREVKSPAWQALAFGNWMREVLIAQCVQPGQTVADLSSARGIDLSKWERAGVVSLAAFDASRDALAELRPRLQRHGKMGSSVRCFDLCAEPVALDAAETRFDAVACLDAASGPLQRCFESERTAQLFHANVSALLAPGGVFFGVAVDAAEVWKRCSGMPRGISQGKLCTLQATGDFGDFGTRYDLDVAGDRSAGYVAHIPAWMRAAGRAGLRAVEVANFLVGEADHRHAFSERHAAQNLGKLAPEQAEIVGLWTTFVFVKE